MSNELKAAKEHNAKLVNDKERVLAKLEVISADAKTALIKTKRP